MGKHMIDIQLPVHFNCSPCLQFPIFYVHVRHVSPNTTQQGVVMIRTRWSSMTNYRIGPHRMTFDLIWLSCRRLHRPRTACITVVNHTLAPYTGSRKCLT